MQLLTTVFCQLAGMSLTAATVILLICSLRLCLKKAPKKFSYWLWTAAAFRLVCPVSVPAPFSLFSLTSAHTVNSYGPVTQMRYLSVDSGIAPAAGNAANPGFPLSAETIFALIWITGLLTMLTLTIISYKKTRRRIRTAVKLAGNVYECSQIRSPFVFGFFRPQIYIPFHLPSDVQKYVLHHEAYHIKHLDHLVKPLAFLILAVHWFNPLVWLAFSLMVRDMEMRCDEGVLRQAGTDIRAGYSLSLLSLAENRRFPSPNPLSFGESSVKARIQNIMTFRQPRRWISAAAAAACFLIMAACAVNPAAPVDSTAPTEPASGSTAPATGALSSTSTQTGSLLSAEAANADAAPISRAHAPGTLLCPDCGSVMELTVDWEAWPDYEEVKCPDFPWGTDLIQSRFGTETAICPDCGSRSSTPVADTKTYCHGFWN